MPRHAFELRPRGRTALQAIVAVLLPDRPRENAVEILLGLTLN